MKKSILLSLILFLCATPAFAQVELSGPALFLNISPQYPAPHAPVTFTVQSPLEDLSLRMITWRNSGAVVLEGEGETVYKTTTSNTGAPLDITVHVEGITDDATVSLRPASVDLMWESNSYAPGLYLGRRIPSHGSLITLSALPHLSRNGEEIPAAQLIYTWKQDDRIVLAGRGKSSATISAAEFSDKSTISVNVSTADKTIGADKSTEITVADPVIRLYFEHPLYGTMLHNALSSESTISDTEMSFAAIPYFTNTTNPNDSQFSYIWRVNNTAVEANNVRPNTLTINAGAAGGAAHMDLSLTHKKNFRLNARGMWDVVFGSIAAQGGANLFGTE